ncbi:gamma-tubulin complex component 5-like [Babylonia areolata]|uniref:gamma-tubulin complex component 5-like n=1 Tax=Babylonia areolata TaxID=304850 RepID=UPI003FD09958
MARLKEETEQLTRQLITKVSGFQESEENFHLCLQFAHSNFRYHRFLDVDSHRVNRLLEGLQTKLQVHSLGPRSDSLRELVSAFVNSPLLDDEGRTSTDTHYGLLLLLCQLADSPTNTEYQPPPPPVEEEPGETFDWAAHLLDGENVFSGRFSDTSSEEEDLPGSSESDDDGGDNDDDKHDDSAAAKQEGNRTVAVVRGGEGVSMDTTLETRGEEWLNQNVMVQYWKGQGQGQGQARGQHTASNLLQDWTSYQVRSGEVYAAVGQQVVTEYQLVRELLWMLSGVDALFLFSTTDSGFRLKEDVRLSHLTAASLESCLSQLISLANRLHGLQSFVDDVIGVSCRQDVAHKSPLGTQTFQAFADSLARVLRDFRAHLSQLEREAAEQDKNECITVSSLLHKLSPWLPTLEVIWEIFADGILQEAEPPDAGGERRGRRCNSARVSQLLTALYDGVVTQDSLGQESTHVVSVLLRLLLETSRPYLDMIGQWISAGHLSDPASEFVLQRNPNIQCLDETFWERAFTLNDNSASDPPHPHDTSSTSSLSSAGRCAEGEEEGGGGLFREAVEGAPRFLRAVMREVVLTGKSMELLQALGRLPEVVQSVRHGASADKSLYQLFVDSLKEVLGTQPSHNAEEEEEELLERESTLSARLYVQHVQTGRRVAGTEDWLLTINFHAVFSSVFTRRLVEHDPYDLKLLGSVEDAYVSPIHLLFRRCLYPHVRHRYTHVCSRLLHILKTEYRLMDFLHSMQHFYLMSAGDAMFDFYTQIFDKMRHQEMWRESSSLTLALQEALQSHHAQHVSRLSVALEMQPKTRERTAVSATDCMRLHFAVPWPVDVVINSKCQNLYNQVFRFLLQIKRAKYGLDQLRFSGLDKTDLQTVAPAKDTLLGSGSRSGSGSEESLSRSERLHRLHILRFRLAYFVNSLHNYIMTRILHSTGLEFASEVREAGDLEEVIEVHARYVRTVHERCLLHRKLTFLREAVAKVLNLTLTFAMRWDQGVHNISGQTLTEMEVEFSRCIQFLASFLNNIIKRGSFPHVEPLAFALVTSLPSGTKY